MFALGLRYLMGWAMAAADGPKKEQAEWPPHPDRIFMALAAAWFETGENPAQGAALRWLESLPAPHMAAADAQFRGAGRQVEPVITYVPVNDSKPGRKPPDSRDLGKLKEAGLSVLPEFRPRQPRSFPVAIPERTDVFLIWPDADAAQHEQALHAMVAQVSHVGHSASLVQMWVEGTPPPATLHPGQGVPARRLRVSYAGRLEHLKAWMNRDACIAHRDLEAAIQRTKNDKRSASDKEAKKLAGTQLKALEAEFETRFGDVVPQTQRPDDARWESYIRSNTESGTPLTPTSLFDSTLLVIGLRGRRYPLTATLRVVEALRGAMLAQCPAPIPEWLSGHMPGSDQPSRNPHVAVFPLSFTSTQHADGRIMGLAMAVPRGVDPGETARCLGPLLWDAETGAPRPFKLFDGRWLEVTAEVELRTTPPNNLQSKTWTGPARAWASVTPIVLDRHFKGADKWDQAAESLNKACERIGLPRPQAVILNPVASVEGVPHARQFPPLQRKHDGGRIQHTHATLVFSEPVTGPVILGAGRFRGYGLCRPINGADGHA